MVLDATAWMHHMLQGVCPRAYVSLLSRMCLWFACACVHVCLCMCVLVCMDNACVCVDNTCVCVHNVCVCAAKCVCVRV